MEGNANRIRIRLLNIMILKLVAYLKRKRASFIRMNVKFRVLLRLPFCQVS